jgi:mercuric ion transport protein
MTSSSRVTAPRRVAWARYGYVLLAGVFAVCVLVQVYIAGMAVFVDPANWELHTTFVHLFELVPFFLFGLAFLGRLPRTLKLLPVGLYALVMVQYATAHLFGSLVAAIHPVNAIVIFGVALVAVKRAWASVSEASTTP